MQSILKLYLQDKLTVHPFDNSKLSKSKRIERMYDIVQDRVYGVKYTKEERVFASKIITEILLEDE